MQKVAASVSFHQEDKSSSGAVADAAHCTVRERLGGGEEGGRQGDCETGREKDQTPGTQAREHEVLGGEGRREDPPARETGQGREKEGRRVGGRSSAGSVTASLAGRMESLSAWSRPWSLPVAVTVSEAQTRTSNQLFGGYTRELFVGVVVKLLKTPKGIHS
eukprot:3791795-Rhodomonas_salina.2